MLELILSMEQDLQKLRMAINKYLTQKEMPTDNTQSTWKSRSNISDVLKNLIYSER